MNPGELALLALVIPAAGAVLVGLLRASPNLREAASLITGGVLLGVVMQIHRAVSAGETPRFVLAEPLPGIPLELVVEPLGMIFALVAGSLWIVTTLYAIGYMRGHHEKNQTRFYIFFALAISCTMGVAFAGNLFTLFIFYEALTLSTFPLVTHAGTDAAKRAGRVYLGILLSTSIGFQLLAIIWTYLLTGTIDFELGGILEGRAGEGVVAVLLALYVFGIGKAAVMPFHRWLARGDGGPYAGQRAAARGGGGEGGRVQHPQGRHLRLRHRLSHAAGRERLAHVGSRRDHHPGVAGGLPERQSEGADWPTRPSASFPTWCWAPCWPTPWGSSAAACTSSCMPSARSPSSSAQEPSWWRRTRPRSAT